MNLGLEKKIVLVTGGARGIGEAIVHGFAEEGAITIIIDKDLSACIQLRDELKLKSKGIDYYHADLTDDDACKSAVNYVLEKYTGIDVLVNNAGINDCVGLDQSSREFRASLGRNLTHYFSMMHYAVTSLKERKGSVVNISSKVGVIGEGGTSGYAAAKAGILGLTREWASELAQYGVRVNTIIPASVKTPLHDSWLQTQKDPGAFLAVFEKRIPLGNRLTTPYEIADLAVFLASCRASHITGEHIFCDGGYTNLENVDFFKM
ncbi:MAG TPA: SDR family oxidoreductase [Candidatus Nanoarchaeia archaeon]|nr:SDR family oxidoreductase [Candidatus Nanoarchaeia archaeon]